MMIRRVSTLALAAGLAFGMSAAASAKSETTPADKANAGADAAATAAIVSDAAPAADTPAADTLATDEGTEGQIVVTAQRTRAVSTLTGGEIQKQLPGINPLKALNTLPGVTFLTGDPWGNNEQNITLFVHGFNQQQLGYTLDGVPLGDQNYGNYNGLSPQRAIISENVDRVTLASGAGDLGTASTSNLGGTIDVFSSDPRSELGAQVQQTFGSYDAFRTFVRIDTGTFGNGNSLYVSGARQDARAWDFDGKQGGYQANGKFVHDDSTGRLAVYLAYSDKTEPNEDATVIAPGRRIASTGQFETVANVPYTRPFIYPDAAAIPGYYPSAQNNYAGSAAYLAAGDNYRNYYSDAQRTDFIGYAKYDWNVSSRIVLSTTAYGHHNDGVGVVAGPITVAGLPSLFSFYYPGVAGSSPTSVTNLARLSGIFGNSGLASRTTEYRIDRGGIISNLKLNIGKHDIELGGWWEHQSSSAYRRWYAFDINNPSSPYTRPLDLAQPLITQYGSEIRVDEFQTHLQDAWHVLPTLTLLAGFKSVFQNAHQNVPVQPIPGSFTGSRELPVGQLDTSDPFLPQVGAIWDATSNEQLFFNIQKNIRQFQTSAAAGLSPFALGSQTLFDFFKANTKPEKSWTYEAGLRTHRTLNWGPITAFEGQISYYHVDFSNRLLAISPTTTITAIASGATILQNVGSVTTNGVDIAGTIHFGRHFSIYNALSYNDSSFDNDYLTGATTVRTAGKQVPGSPNWLNKTVVSANYRIFNLQLTGQYLGRRFGTFTNDLSTPGYYELSGRLAASIPLPQHALARTLDLSVNVTNIAGATGASSLSIGQASGTFNAFPVAPRQVFGTIGVRF